MTRLHERLLDYPRIVADLHGERVTLFVGAGFSGFFRDLPSWDDLVAYLWTELGRKPTAKSRPKDLYLQMATLAELHWKAQQKQLGRPPDGLPNDDALRSKIRSFLQDRIGETPETKHADLWQRILGLGFYDWVTTNWDDLLESSMGEAVVMRRGQHLEELARERRLRRGMLNPTPEHPFVIKIHGCLTRPRGMVVTMADMQDFREEDLYLRSLLVKRFIEQTIVFLGYSLRDDNIIDVIEGVRGEILRLSPDMPSNQLLLFWSPPGHTVGADEERRLERLTKLGVIVESFSGFDEFFAAVEAIRRQPPPSLVADELAASLLDIARKAGDVRGKDRRVWISRGRERKGEPPLRDSMEWFLADVLPSYPHVGLDDWASAFERMVHTSTESRRMVRYMGPPTHRQHYQVAIKRLVREIATHVAAEQEGAGPEAPLDRILRTLDEEELKGPARLRLVASDLAHYVDKVHDPDVRAFFRRWSIQPGKRKPVDREMARERVRNGIFTDQKGRRLDVVGEDVL